MNVLNRNTVQADSYTERILQFGEGNFLRAFANWMLHEMNHQANFDAGAVVIQPIANGLIKTLNDNFVIYVGGENLTNFTQEAPIIDFENPFGPNFNASQIYAPVMGATGYIGIRWTLLKND